MDAARLDRVLRHQRRRRVSLRPRSGAPDVDEARRPRRRDRQRVVAAPRSSARPGEYVDYAASKAALDTLTIGLAREVAAEGIRVNARPRRASSTPRSTRAAASPAASIG